MAESEPSSERVTRIGKYPVAACGWSQTGGGCAPPDRPQRCKRPTHLRKRLMIFHCLMVPDRAWGSASKMVLAKVPFSSFVVGEAHVHLDYGVYDGQKSPEVLIHMEDICAVVRSLHVDQPLIWRPVGRLFKVVRVLRATPLRVELGLPRRGIIVTAERKPGDARHLGRRERGRACATRPYNSNPNSARFVQAVAAVSTSG